MTAPHQWDSCEGVADAYSAAGEAWHGGPTRIYDTLAREQIATAGVSLAEAAVLDLGTGTGAASRAAAAAGARSVTAVDVAAGMLMVDRERRPPAAVGDALALPFADSVFDVTIAAFSLNHLDDPVAALREASRVTRDRGWVLSSSYATDDSHPVKRVVDEVARRWGWNPADWFERFRSQTAPRLATAERVRDVATAAGLTEIAVERRSVAFAELGPADMVAWRLGMAQLAGFVAGLEAQSRRALEEEAIGALGTDPPILERSVLFLTARVPTPEPD
ncbi:MAG TPA: methyltransferase domain-containing protein [Ilumatobacteraceae bacterium]|nr:methyltransferase domain-containing protein [Ilumatobacteraceae bacterium]